MLESAQYWLLLRVSETPQAFVRAAGVLTALLLIAATAVILFMVDEARTAGQHAQAAETASALVTESTDLLDQLLLNNNTDCESAHLIQLNALLLRSRFIREIGILDEQGRLVCATTMGRLPTPVVVDHPAITTLSGKQVLIDVPLLVTNKKVKATIIRKGQFSVVVGPHLTESLYASADVVWLKSPDGLALLNATPMSADELERWRTRAQALQSRAWPARGAGYEQITAQPDTSWVFQTRRNIGEIMHDNGVLLISMFVSALLITILVVGTLTPYISRLRRIENRVRFLCDEEHILLTYQPVFDLNSMRVVGCEVLMRLKEGDRIWMPGQIIPAVLRTGLARRFDHAVTRKAIRELSSRLPAQKNTFCVALNFFPESIDRNTLLPVLREALSATPRDDIKIVMEVTEYSLSNALINEVKGFKDEGFQIAIDDFGTGYSNLKSVTQLSPDRIKIDRSFVFELKDATVRSTLIPEIVRMAEAVGALTIAEGIECVNQVKLLANMGVRYGQGYALARPMELGPFLVLLNATC